MPNTVIQTDDLNEHDWQQITTIYNADETTKSQVEILYDSGLIERFKYDETGRFVERTLVDIDDPSRNPSSEIISQGGLFNWNSVNLVTEDHPDGYYVGLSVNYDSNRTFIYPRVQFFDTSETMNIVTDDTNMYDWEAMFQSTYSDDTTLEFNVVLYDDGTHVTNHYHNTGKLDYIHKNDLGDNETWRSKKTFYDSQGMVDRIITHWDNGGYSDFHYSDTGSIIKKVINDNSEDSYNWSRRETVFEQDGSLKALDTIYDDGRRLKQDYEDGVIVSSTILDRKNAYSWRKIITTYDENGKRIQKTKTDDNGVETDTFFFTDGSKKTTKADKNNVKDWDKTIVQVDADGNRSLSAVLEDDQDVIANYFDDGARTMQVFEDVSDSKSWYARVRNYDENGGLVDTVYYDSYEDLNDATGYTSPFPEIA